MTKFNRDSYRQGDVYLEPVEAMPDARHPVAPERGRVILAHGEATGHHHSFAMSERIALFREDGSGGGLFLSVLQPAVLEHQEHTALTIPPGSYRVIQPLEYTPAAIVRVVD